MRKLTIIYVFYFCYLLRICDITKNIIDILLFNKLNPKQKGPNKNRYENMLLNVTDNKIINNKQYHDSTVYDNNSKDR